MINTKKYVLKFMKNIFKQIVIIAICCEYFFVISI